MPPNVTAALQQKQHQPFIPSPAPNKYAHMHNVSGFIYNLYNGNDNNKWNFKLCFKWKYDDEDDAAIAVDKE